MFTLFLFLTILTLTVAVGFTIIYKKISDPVTPDIKLTVNIPDIKIQQTTQPHNTDLWVQSSSGETKKLTESVNPVEYIKQTKSEAHIKWDDTEQ